MFDETQWDLHIGLDLLTTRAIAIQVGRYSHGRAEHVGCVFLDIALVVAARAVVVKLYIADWIVSLDECGATSGWHGVDSSNEAAGHGDVPE